MRHQRLPKRKQPHRARKSRIERAGQTDQDWKQNRHCHSGKTGQALPPTIASYEAMATPHLENDNLVIEEETRNKGRILNGFTFQFARVLGLCRTCSTRTKSALNNTNLEPPKLRFDSVKDRKKIHLSQMVLPSRPICAATQSPTGQLSHVISSSTTSQTV